MTALTKAQIYTLRRMKWGAKFQLRADGEKARECRTGPHREPRHKMDRSIPVLYRLGYVAYASGAKGLIAGMWYMVEVTKEGEAVRDLYKDLDLNN